jgi:hypothetical protein
MISCGCRFDEDDRDDELERDGNGDSVEVVEVDGQPVVVHYADLPDKDRTALMAERSRLQSGGAGAPGSCS